MMEWSGVVVMMVVMVVMVLGGVGLFVCGEGR